MNGIICYYCPFYNENSKYYCGYFDRQGDNSYIVNKINCAKQFIKLFKEDRMTFQEAVKEMICGKRVCCAEWTNPSCYYHLVDEMIMDQHNDVDFPLSCWIDKYWKIWEDPKKKVKITITVNGKPVDPKDISEETWNNLR